MWSGFKRGCLCVCVRERDIVYVYVVFFREKERQGGDQHYYCFSPDKKEERNSSLKTKTKILIAAKLSSLSSLL